MIRQQEFLPDIYMSPFLFLQFVCKFREKNGNVKQVINYIEQRSATRYHRLTINNIQNTFYLLEYKKMR